MGSKIIDLGKEVEITVESGCWCSALSQSQITLRGNLRAIERTLEQALQSIREDLNGSR